MHIFIYLSSNLYCLTPLFLIVCQLSISSSFVLFPIYSSKTGLCLLQYSQLRRGCDICIIQCICIIPSAFIALKHNNVHKTRF